MSSVTNAERRFGRVVLAPLALGVFDVVHALGARVDEVPITPQKILKALARKAKGEPAREGPGRVPDFAWPEPLRVPPPWAGGDGRAIGDEREIGKGGVREGAGEKRP